jgi:hypothetical protein
MQTVSQYQLLAGLVAGRAPTLPVDSEGEWIGLVELAQAEGVGPLLAHSLQSLPEVAIPDPVREALAMIYRQAVYNSLIHRSARAQLCRHLHVRQIPVLLLKGAELSFRCYDDPATRPMQDVDLLVPRSRVKEAACCLEEIGFHPLSGSLSAELQRPRGHLVYIHTLTQAMVELHWELKLLGRAQAAAIPEIWSGVSPAAGDPAALVMRLGHLLPILCAHMLLQHRTARLLWLYDLHRVLLTMDSMEAALARDAATRWSLAPCTALALKRVQELFDTPLPVALEEWVGGRAPRDGLQARVARQALAADIEAPSEYLMSLLMNRNYSTRSILVPALDDLRQRLRLQSHERVGPIAYMTFVAQRLRNGPLHFRQLWRFWRTTSHLSDQAARQPCRDQGWREE